MPPAAASRTYRLRLSVRELGIVEGCAAKVGMSRVQYLIRCLETPRSKGRLLSLPEIETRTQAFSFRLPSALRHSVELAASQEHLNVLSYIRCRLLGGLAPSDFSALQKRNRGRFQRRGRPRASDYLLTIEGGDQLAAMLSDATRTRAFTEAVFSLLSRAGVRGGDVDAVLEICKLVYKTQHVASSSGHGFEVFGWTPLGEVKLFEPPPEARAGAKVLAFHRSQQGQRPG